MSEQLLYDALQEIEQIIGDGPNRLKLHNISARLQKRDSTVFEEAAELFDMLIEERLRIWNISRDWKWL